MRQKQSEPSAHSTNLRHEKHEEASMQTRSNMDLRQGLAGWWVGGLVGRGFSYRVRLALRI